MNLPALFSRLPSVNSLTGLGANVLAALKKPTGTAGAVQLNGDPVNPTRINLPDITGLTGILGDIGLNAGKLSVADGVTPGGRNVAQRRITGSKLMDFGTQLQSAAFVKLVGLPLAAGEMQAGKYVSVSGFVSIGMGYQQGSITGITQMRFGTCWLEQSTAYAEVDGAYDAGTTGMDVSNRIRYDVSSGPKQLVVGSGGVRMLYAPDFLKNTAGGSSTFLQSFAGGPSSAGAAGVANELCFKLQINRSAASGNYAATKFLDVIYDLTLEVF